MALDWIVINVLFAFLYFGTSDNRFYEEMRKDQNRIISDSANIIFKDTVANFVFDSLEVNLGTIQYGENTMFLVKYFKYIGEDSLRIKRTFTSDPHYICKSPTVYLEKGKIYTYTICIAKPTINGQFHKVMGFIFSNGSKVNINISGNLVLKNKE